jgi:hypothetical protein
MVGPNFGTTSSTSTPGKLTKTVCTTARALTPSSLRYVCLPAWVASHPRVPPYATDGMRLMDMWVVYPLTLGFMAHLNSGAKLSALGT